MTGASVKRRARQVNELERLMGIRYLKSGKPQVERSEDDAKVRAVVEAVSYTHLTLPTILLV